jgi:hypothetical protein
MIPWQLKLKAVKAGDNHLLSAYFEPKARAIFPKIAPFIIFNGIAPIKSSISLGKYAYKKFHCVGSMTICLILLCPDSEAVMA